MKALPDSDSPDEAPAPVEYEPPLLRSLGNVHDLLAMAKCAPLCDAGPATDGEVGIDDGSAC
jgi:hypothetical protein